MSLLSQLFRRAQLLRLIVFTIVALSVCVSARPHRAARAKASTKKSAVAPAEKVKLVVDGALRKSVVLYRFNNVQYCAFNSLHVDSVVAPTAKASSRSKKKNKAPLVVTTQNSNEVIISNHLIHAQPTSFFVAAEKDDQQRLVQMTLPTITIHNTVLVPFPQFFEALSTLGLCTFNELENSVQWVQESKRTRAVAQSADDAINPLTPPIPLTSEKKVAAQKGKLKAKLSTPSEDEVPQLQPATKATPTPEPEPPATLRYQLPLDLKRRELDDTVKSNEHSLNYLHPLGGDAADSEASQEWLASLVVMGKARPARITSIHTGVEKGVTSIHFESDKNLEEVPTPEFDKGLIRVHFPGAVNSVKDLSVIRKLNVSSVASALEDGEEVYSIQLKSAERSVKVERINDRHIVLHIAPLPVKTATAHSKWNLDVIVIDAGHGGKDVGAESIHKKYEKDITLAVALKLRDEIHKKMPETKIVLTRSTDVFVELDKRGEIANKAGGKLFISVHCNSTPTRPTPASGFETFVLSPAKTNTAVEVAKRENAVIQLEDKADRYKGLNDDQLIVATLAQNSFVKLSSTFAALVQKNMKVCTSMCERSVNQAGFIVLIGASMPAVLVETGFVTNASDEKMMTSAAGQAKIAKGIASAVKEYAGVYSKMLRN